jgi:asparagine synthase (glutamine-hydrolysing)
MCGLSAILDFSPGGSLLPALLAMHRCIEHRGPDGEGFVVVDAAGQTSHTRTLDEAERLPSAGLSAGLGFRWLQIQDRNSRAAQPMATADGQIWLIFNGEIYNFRELARELETLGHRFTTVGDTEVILAAYKQWGRDCFAHFNGMWAIVLLDLRERKLVFSRDRFGIKPLFYHWTPQRLIVASEVKQILAAGVAPVADLASVAGFVTGARPETPERTCFRDIAAQPAATTAEVAFDAAATPPVFRPFWSLEPDHAGTPPPFDEACSHLEGLLRTSVAEHMVAQVPIGNLVSGGLDSSLVAALAAPNYRAAGQRGLAASMVLDGGPSHLDESIYIDQVTAALEFDGFKAALTPAWLKDNIGRVTMAQEEPVAGMAVVGQYLAYETAARHGARVVLDGQGADEIFAGYPRHQYVVLRDYAARGAWGDMARELMSLAGHDPKFFADIWRRSLRPRLMRLFGSAPVRPRYDFIRRNGQARRLRPESSAALPRRSALERDLFTDVVTGNLRPALAMTDRNSMAHSVEARVPYVDRRVVEYGFALPDGYKIGAGRRKRILRAIAARYLPASIVDRIDRIGFGVPIAAWLMTDFRSELAQLADGPTYRNAGFVDRAALGRYVEEFLNGSHQNAGAVWRLYAIDRWAQAFAVQGL